MNEIKKRFVKMTCKSCNQITVMEYEGTTADEYNAVQMGCNSPSKPLSRKIPSPPRDCIKNALKRLKDQYSFGIPDKLGDSAS